MGSIYPSLPEYCDPQSQFLLRISAAFHSCVPTNLAFLSTLLGSLSILSWLFAQIPQILKNYSNQSTYGLSVYFLLIWCLGDTANLLGALFTGQAAWQQVVAGYYVCVDVVLVFQYTWYTHIRPRRDEKGGLWRSLGGDDGDVVEGVPVSDAASEQSTNDRKQKSDGGSPTSKTMATPLNPFRLPTSSPPREKGTASSSTTLSSPLGSSLTQEKNSLRSNRTITRPASNSILPASSPQTMIFLSLLLAVAANASPLQQSTSISLTSEADSSNRMLAGRILSWLSTLLYLGSRLPQIYQNARLRSTAGLSPALFIAAFFGNLFYSSSILTNPLAWGSYPPHGLHGWAGDEGSERAEWVQLAIPFWLGAAGVLMLDATVGAQFLIYGEGLREFLEELLEEDEVGEGTRRRRARKGLRRISGWMRGWVPSGSFSSRKDVERSLLGEQRDGTGYGAA